MNRIKRNAKTSYYNTKCEEYRNNTKKLCQVINQTIGKQNHGGSIIPYISIEEIKTYDPKKISNAFQSFYANLGSDLAKKIQSGRTSIDEYINMIPCNLNNLALRQTTEKEIRTLIFQLPNESSSGHDQISNKLLKGIGEPISYPLTIVFNQSITQGIFPDIMKLADVTPLYKGKEKDEVINYQPISLLMTLSKILKKIIYKRVYNYLDKNNILYESQYGFRNKCSCEQAITELLDHILQAKESNHFSASVFLDLSKAFDTLNHDVLLKKLDRYGI